MDTNCIYLYVGFNNLQKCEIYPQDNAYRDADNQRNHHRGKQELTLFHTIASPYLRA